MKGKGNAVKIFMAFFLFQSVLSIFMSVYSIKKQEVSGYVSSGDIELGETSVVHVGQEYGGYTAREGYTLYQIDISMTNHSLADYTVIDKCSYYADTVKTSSNLKGNVSAGGAGSSYETECDIIFSNCADLNGVGYERFGWESLTVIPSHCMIVYQDIVEVPIGAVQMTVDYYVYGDKVIMPLQ